MMEPGLYHICLSARTFSLSGIYGFFTRRNLITMLMSIELDAEQREPEFYCLQ